VFNVSQDSKNSDKVDWGTPILSATALWDKLLKFNLSYVCIRHNFPLTLRSFLIHEHFYEKSVKIYIEKKHTYQWGLTATQK
jgi:hypothetical protein